MLSTCATCIQTLFLFWRFDDIAFFGVSNFTPTSLRFNYPSVRLWRMRHRRRNASPAIKLVPSRIRVHAKKHRSMPRFIDLITAVFGANLQDRILCCRWNWAWCWVLLLRRWAVTNLGSCPWTKFGNQEMLPAWLPTLLTIGLNLKCKGLLRFYPKPAED